MPGSALIADYLDYLSRRLPRQVVEELADGLQETYHRYLGQGMAPDAAARAATTEFGGAELIAAHFTRAHPARRAARAMLTAGPAVGVCWAAALVTGRAWTWPVPVIARIALGLVLACILVLLARAMLSTRYVAVTRAGAAGCIGLLALDITMIAGVLAADPAPAWPAIIAIAASAARLTFAARLLHPVLVTR
jgi:hypothetical protein